MSLFGFGNQGHREQHLRDHRKHEEGGIHFIVAKEAHELLSAARHLRSLGHASHAQQKIREALQVVRRALRRCPQSLFLSRFLCGIYFELRDFTAVEHCLKHLIAERALEDDADLTEPYTRLGIIRWYHGKDVSAALEYFHRALGAVKEDTSPDAASEPHLHLARIYLELNDPQSARAHAEQRLRMVGNCRQASMIYELVSGDASLEARAGATT